MKNNQKGFALIEVLVAFVILVNLGISGVAGWTIWRANNNNYQPNNKTYTKTVCSTTVQTSGNESFQLPSDWRWHELRDVGIRYAYPATWTSPTDQTNSGAQKYVTSFTVGSFGANITVSLAPDCEDFQSILTDINNGKYDTQSGSITTRKIGHNQVSYSLLSHWSSAAGNHYKLTTHNVVGIGSMRSILVEYGVVTGSETCPDDRLASNDQQKCIKQSVSDEIDKVISSLQKI